MSVRGKQQARMSVRGKQLLEQMPERAAREKRRESECTCGSFPKPQAITVPPSIDGICWLHDPAAVSVLCWAKR